MFFFEIDHKHCQPALVNQSKKKKLTSKQIVENFL